MFENLDSKLFDDGFLNFLIFTLIILAITIVLTKIINRIQKYVLDKYSSKRNTSIKYAFKTLRAVLYIFACFAVLSEIKPLKTLGTALLGATSVIAVIVGLAAQESFGNYISGFFLAIYEPFHIGDFISLPEKNIYGTVKEINFRHIVIETLNSSKIVIPNSLMNSAIIEDKTGGHYKNKINLTLEYGSDIDKVRNIVSSVVLDNQKKLGINNKECNVNVENLGDNGIVIGFYVEGKTLSDSYKIACNVREELLGLFDKNHIDLAYPTSTTYIKK